MKHRTYLKRPVVVSGVIMILFLILFLGAAWAVTEQIMENQNKKTLEILGAVKEQYPDVKKEDLIRILDGQQKEDEEFAALYGIDVKKEAIVEENAIAFRALPAILFLGIFLSAVSVAVVFVICHVRQDRELLEITKHLEAINHHDYRYDMDSVSEDSLSILKDEVYKTTIMLKETAEYSMRAKNSLKESISDISHQLKTPLASILLTLDNLLDHPEMEEERRQEYLRNVKREIRNMNFLVRSLLKLSQLDADAIVFLKEEITAGELVLESVRNVETICDLKNIEIILQGAQDAMLLCDKSWQVEALTNVLKNAVEHSKDGSEVLISMGENAIDTWIRVRDHAGGMDAEEQKHIFERFYKGKNSQKDSIGIGLALTKSIVESENGRISVESDEVGSTFLLRYYKA